MVEQVSAPRDVTVPLLDRIIDESLDQDYRLAAARRVDHHAAKSVRPGRPAWLILGVFGLLVGTAAVQSAQSAGDSAIERSSLIAQIETRRDRVAEQQQDLTDVRATTRSLNEELDSIEQKTNASEATITRLEPPTGFAPVNGPGLRMMVDDAPNAVDIRLVRADDLSTLVNGLWAAGAEAISIDDQRLTTLSSLRNSGLTVGVNRVSLRAPYTVKAIGNPQTLEANLLDSTSGLTWQALVNQLGFRFEVQTVKDMSLPGEQLRPLRSATVKRDVPKNEPGQEDRP